MTLQTDWDIRYLKIAEMVAGWSKDPSTKCGAVIVRPDKTVCSIGYNGFPSGIEETPDMWNNRELKNNLVIHAEENALLHSRDQDMTGYTIYIWPIPPCSRCMMKIMQKGIREVVTTTNDNPRLKDMTDDGMTRAAKAGMIIYRYNAKGIPIQFNGLVNSNPEQLQLDIN